MTDKEWEPKTSDVFLVTGGQIKRLRDGQTQEERNAMIPELRRQNYKKGGNLNEE